MWPGKIIFALFASILLQCTTAVAQGSRMPNILFIMSDDHSFRAIGAYNESLKALNITPHIDQLAEE
ncbi:MAG: sulfatase, partial [Bacteroidales bacterium]|nr:sulfatase [Bacteroidales bacterium]